MSREFIESNLRQSASDFAKIVWPRIRGHERIGGGEIRPVEAETAEDLAVQLDMLAGIDAWHILENRAGMRGIGSRVQWKNDYSTFSIRYRLPSGADTEYDKRLRAIKSSEGLIYPHFTVQAYLDNPNGTLLSAAVISTKSLFLEAERLMESGQLEFGSRQEYGLRITPQGETFIYASWEYIADSAIQGDMIVFR